MVGEFDDFSLLLTFAEAGHGVSAVPMVLDGVMRRRYGLERIGQVNEVRAQFYTTKSRNVCRSHIFYAARGVNCFTVECRAVRIAAIALRPEAVSW